MKFTKSRTLMAFLRQLLTSEHGNFHRHLPSYLQTAANISECISTQEIGGRDLSSNHDVNCLLRCYMDREQ